MKKRNYDPQVQEAITHRIGFTADEHNQFIYDNGIAYLKEFAPDYPQVVSEISKTISFWNWWLKHFEDRDREFIEMNDDAFCDKDLLKLMYEEHHDVPTLASAIYLNGMVLQDSYANLMDEITKNQRVVKEKEVACDY